MNVIVTGVSKGLGLVISQSLLESGNTVFGISRSKSDRLCQLINAYPDKMIHLQYDLTEIKDIKDKVFKKWIGFDTAIQGLVNNAATAYDDIVTNLRIIDLEKMYYLNVFAPMIMTKYTIRNMLLHHNKGSLVHISSISAHTGYKGLSMYGSTKGSLESFSKNVAREWGELGIRSNCLVSGFMETEMSATLSADQRKRIYQRTSLKQPVNMTCIAKTIEFLLSEKAESITGQNIHVDAGTI